MGPTEDTDKARGGEVSEHRKEKGVELCESMQGSSNSLEHSRGERW